MRGEDRKLVDEALEQMKRPGITQEEMEKHFRTVLEAVGRNSLVEHEGRYPMRYKMDSGGRMIPGSEYRVGTDGEPYDPAEDPEAALRKLGSEGTREGLLHVAPFGRTQEEKMANLRRAHGMPPPEDGAE